MRLLAYDGRDLGIMPTLVARRLAEEQGLELVLVDADLNPPICRLLDFEKFKYENQRRDKRERRQVTPRARKQLTIHPGIGPHDLAQKVAQLRRLLRTDHCCRLFVPHPGPAPEQAATARSLLDGVVAALGDTSRLVETEHWQGRMSVALLAPRQARTYAPIIVWDR